jgi:hypothetical protein
MKRTSTVRIVASCLILAGLACSLPGTGEPPATEVAPPPETEAPPLTESPPVTEAAPVTEPPAAEPLVVTHADSQFRLYALDGSLVDTWAASGLEWVREGVAQVVGDGIYYVDSGGASLGGVVRRVSGADVTELSFTAAPVPASLTFAVSSDGARIAWAHSGWDTAGNTSKLWVAGIDGAGQTLVVQASPNDAIDDYYVLEPVTWTADGNLVFAWQISGIGGYILYFGYSTLFSYNPDLGATAELAGFAVSPGAPCWNSLSPDGAFAIGSCVLAGGAAGMRERDLATGGENVFPVWPEDQGQDGAGVYSPSGAQVAYSIARGNMDDEAGHIIIAPHLGSDVTLVASVAGGTFDRILWADEDRLVAGYWVGDTNSVDLIRLSDLARTPVGEGRLVGLLWP